MSDLEAVAQVLAARVRPIAHVNFLDGSDSHANHTLATDQTDSVRRHDDRVDVCVLFCVTVACLQANADQVEALHFFMLQLVLNHTIVLETLRDQVCMRCDSASMLGVAILPLLTKV